MLKAKLLAASATKGTGGVTPPTPPTPTGNGLPLNGTPSLIASNTQNVKLIDSAGSTTAGCALNIVSSTSPSAMTAQLLGETTSGPTIGILASATSTVNTGWVGNVITDNLNSTTIIYAADAGNTTTSRFIGTMTRSGTSSLSISSTGNLTVNSTSNSATSNFDICTIGSSNALFTCPPLLSGATATGTNDAFLLAIDGSNNITQVGTATNTPTFTGSGGNIATVALSNSLVVYAYSNPNQARGSNNGHIYIGAADVNTTAKTVNMNGTLVVEPTYTTNIYAVGNPMVCAVNSTSAIVSWYETFASASQINYQAFAYVTVGAGGSVTINSYARIPVLGSISSYNRRFRLDSNGSFYIAQAVNPNWLYVDYSNFMASVTPNTTAKTIALGTPTYFTDYYQALPFAPVCYNGVSYISSCYPRTSINNTSYYDALGGVFKPTGSASWGATFVGNKSTLSISSGTGTMSSAATAVAGVYMPSQNVYSLGYCDNAGLMRESAGIVPYNTASVGNNSGQGGSGSTYYAGPFNVGGYSSSNAFISYMKDVSTLYYGNGYAFGNYAPSIQNLNSLAVLNGNTAIFGQTGNYFLMFYNTTAGLLALTAKAPSGNLNILTTGTSIATYSSPVSANTTLAAIQVAYSTPKYIVASNWYNSGGVATAQLIVVNANSTFTTVTSTGAVSSPFACAAGTKPQLTALSYSSSTGYTLMYAGIDASGNIKAAPVTVLGNTITVGTVSTLFTGQTSSAIGQTPRLVALSPTEAMLSYGGNVVLLTYNSTTGAITAGTPYATGATYTTNTTLINPNTLQMDVPYAGTDRVLAFAVSTAAPSLSITQIHRV